MCFICPAHTASKWFNWWPVFKTKYLISGQSYNNHKIPEYHWLTLALSSGFPLEQAVWLHFVTAPTTPRFFFIIRLIWLVYIVFLFCASEFLSPVYMLCCIHLSLFFFRQLTFCSRRLDDDHLLSHYSDSVSPTWPPFLVQSHRGRFLGALVFKMELVPSPLAHLPRPYLPLSLSLLIVIWFLNHQHWKSLHCNRNQLSQMLPIDWFKKLKEQ